LAQWTRVSRRVHEYVALRPTDEIRVGAEGGSRVVAAAIHIGCELLREQMRRLLAMVFGCDGRGWAQQCRAPGSLLVSLARRLACEDGLAFAVND